MISETQLKALESLYSDLDSLREMGIDEFSDDVLGLVWEMRGLLAELAFLTNKISELESRLTTQESMKNVTQCVTSL